MGIKVIVEFQAKPGARAELKSLLESITKTHGRAHRASSAARCTSNSTALTDWLRLPSGSPQRRRLLPWSRPPRRVSTLRSWSSLRLRSRPRGSAGCPNGSRSRSLDRALFDLLAPKHVGMSGPSAYRLRPGDSTQNERATVLRQPV